MIPEAIARILTHVPADLIFDVAHLIKRIVESDNPKDALARAAQVLAHDKGADAVLDAAFAAKVEVKNRVPGSGV
jgi:hypothetical protein